MYKGPIDYTFQSHAGHRSLGIIEDNGSNVETMRNMVNACLDYLEVHVVPLRFKSY